MTIPLDIDELIVTVEGMPRPDLVEMLRTIPCPFPIDFTDAYLSSLSVERLRHLVVAVCLQARKSSRATHAA
jgi:hypothetical protein